MTLKELTAQYGMDAKLLKRYFEAFANLYGICPLRKAKQIINRQNREMGLTDGQILAFADNYKGNWRIVSPSEVYSNIEEDSPMQREIVSKQLVYYQDCEEYVYQRKLQGNKDYFIPEKEELLKYAAPEYYEKTTASQAMEDYLREIIKVPDCEQRLAELMWDLRLDNFDIQTFLGEFDFPSMDAAEQAIKLYTNLSNNTRQFANRGFTPNEMHTRMQPYTGIPYITFGPGIQSSIRSGELDADELVQGISSMNIPAAMKSNLVAETRMAQQTQKIKVGRNDPCPCGSGKKYKKCCGR